MRKYVLGENMDNKRTRGEWIDLLTKNYFEK